MYKNISVENCILSDYPEVLDETLKIKWNGLKEKQVDNFLEIYLKSLS
jgi:hypothetical protein